VLQTPPMADALLELRSFMFANVYLGPTARQTTAQAADMVEALLLYFIAHADDIPGDDDPVTRATDWVAGMTDRYCIRAYDELLAPR